MPAFFEYVLEAFFSVLALVAIALFVEEAIARLQAGPVRFRLALASRVVGQRVAMVAWSRRQGTAAVYGWVRMFFVLGILLTALTVRTRGEAFYRVAPGAAHRTLPVHGAVPISATRCEEVAGARLGVVQPGDRGGCPGSPIQL